jgi:hypothetical protein
VSACGWCGVAAGHAPGCPIGDALLRAAHPPRRIADVLAPLACIVAELRYAVPGEREQAQHVALVLRAVRSAVERGDESRLHRLVAAALA